MARAVAPVVGKALEASIVVLLLTLLSTALYAGAVPGYRSTAGAEVGERVLVETATRIQQAVPPVDGEVTVRHHVALPVTIRGESYRLRIAERRLHLVHPRPEIGGSVPLALPQSVESATGSWTSREGLRALIHVQSTGRGLAVRLATEAAP